MMVIYFVILQILIWAITRLSDLKYLYLLSDCGEMRLTFGYSKLFWGEVWCRNGVNVMNKERCSSRLLHGCATNKSSSYCRPACCKNFCGCSMRRINFTITENVGEEKLINKRSVQQYMMIAVIWYIVWYMLVSVYC